MEMTDNVSRNTEEYQRKKKHIMALCKVLYKKKGKRFGDSSCFDIRELLEFLKFLRFARDRVTDASHLYTYTSYIYKRDDSQEREKREKSATTRRRHP